MYLRWSWKVVSSIFIALANRALSEGKGSTSGNVSSRSPAERTEDIKRKPVSGIVRSFALDLDDLRRCPPFDNSIPPVRRHSVCRETNSTSLDPQCSPAANMKNGDFVSSTWQAKRDEGTRNAAVVASRTEEIFLTQLVQRAQIFLDTSSAASNMLFDNRELPSFTGAATQNVRATEASNDSIRILKHGGNNKIAERPQGSNSALPLCHSMTTHPTATSTGRLVSTKPSKHSLLDHVVRKRLSTPLTSLKHFLQRAWVAAAETFQNIRKEILGLLVFSGRIRLFPVQSDEKALPELLNSLYGSGSRLQTPSPTDLLSPRLKTRFTGADNQRQGIPSSKDKACNGSKRVGDDQEEFLGREDFASSEFAALAREKLLLEQYYDFGCAINGEQSENNCTLIKPEEYPQLWRDDTYRRQKGDDATLEGLPRLNALKHYSKRPRILPMDGVRIWMLPVNKYANHVFRPPILMATFISADPTNQFWFREPKIHLDKGGVLEAVVLNYPGHYGTLHTFKRAFPAALPAPDTYNALSFPVVLGETYQMSILPLSAQAQKRLRIEPCGRTDLARTMQTGQVVKMPLDEYLSHRVYRDGFVVWRKTTPVAAFQSQRSERGGELPQRKKNGVGSAPITLDHEENWQQEDGIEDSLLNSILEAAAVSLVDFRTVQTAVEKAKSENMTLLDSLNTTTVIKRFPFAERAGRHIQEIERFYKKGKGSAPPFHEPFHKGNEDDDWVALQRIEHLRARSVLHEIRQLYYERLRPMLTFLYEPYFPEAILRAFEVLDVQALRLMSDFARRRFLRGLELSLTTTGSQRGSGLTLLSFWNPVSSGSVFTKPVTGDCTFIWHGLIRPEVASSESSFLLQVLYELTFLAGSIEPVKPVGVLASSSNFKAISFLWDFQTRLPAADREAVKTLLRIFKVSSAPELLKLIAETLLCWETNCLQLSPAVSGEQSSQQQQQRTALSTADIRLFLEFILEKFLGYINTVKKFRRTGGGNPAEPVAMELPSAKPRPSDTNSEAGRSPTMEAAAGCVIRLEHSELFVEEHMNFIPVLHNNGSVIPVGTTTHSSDGDKLRQASLAAVVEESAAKSFIFGRLFAKEEMDSILTAFPHDTWQGRECYVEVGDTFPSGPDFLDNGPLRQERVDTPKIIAKKSENQTYASRGDKTGSAADVISPKDVSLTDAEVDKLIGRLENLRRAIRYVKGSNRADITTRPIKPCDATRAYGMDGKTVSSDFRTRLAIIDPAAVIAAVIRPVLRERFSREFSLEEKIGARGHSNINTQSFSELESGITEEPFEAIPTNRVIRTDVTKSAFIARLVEALSHTQQLQKPLPTEAGCGASEQSDDYGTLGLQHLATKHAFEGAPAIQRHLELLEGFVVKRTIADQFESNDTVDRSSKDTRVDQTGNSNSEMFSRANAAAAQTTLRSRALKKNLAARNAGIKNGMNVPTQLPTHAPVNDKKSRRYDRQRRHSIATLISRNITQESDSQETDETVDISAEGEFDYPFLIGSAADVLMHRKWPNKGRQIEENGWDRPLDLEMWLSLDTEVLQRVRSGRQQFPSPAANQDEEDATSFLSTAQTEPPVELPFEDKTIADDRTSPPGRTQKIDIPTNDCSHSPNAVRSDIWWKRPPPLPKQFERPKSQLRYYDKVRRMFEDVQALQMLTVKKLFYGALQLKEPLDFVDPSAKSKWEMLKRHIREATDSFPPSVNGTHKFSRLSLEDMLGLSGIKGGPNSAYLFGLLEPLQKHEITIRKKFRRNLLRKLLREYDVTESESLFERENNMWDSLRNRSRYFDELLSMYMTDLALDLQRMILIDNVLRSVSHPLVSRSPPIGSTDTGREKRLTKQMGSEATLRDNVELLKIEQQLREIRQSKDKPFPRWDLRRLVRRGNSGSSFTEELPGMFPDLTASFVIDQREEFSYWFRGGLDRYEPEVSPE